MSKTKLSTLLALLSLSACVKYLPTPEDQQITVDAARFGWQKAGLPYDVDELRYAHVRWVDDTEFVRKCRAYPTGAAECLDSYHEPIAILRKGEPLIDMCNSAGSVATHAWFHELTYANIRYSLGDAYHQNKQVWVEAAHHARDYIQAFTGAKCQK